MNKPTFDEEKTNNNVADILEKVIRSREARDQNTFNQCAYTSKKLYDSFIAAGFTERQALELLFKIIESGYSNNTIDGGI